MVNTTRRDGSRGWAALLLGILLATGALVAPVQPAQAARPAAAVAQEKPEVKAERPAAKVAASQAQDDPPDLTKFQKVVLGQGTELGEVMELTVADDGRVFFITRAGDIQMYDPVSGSINIIMNNPELGVWSGLEDGGLGITLDPGFADNGWIYVYYAPLPASYTFNRLSRLTVEEGEGGEVFVDKASEKVLLEVGTQRNICCHSAGSLQFDGNGILHLATGDNTSSSDNGGFSPHDERPGRSDYDAQKSSGNTNDLRGKIIRIRPRADDNGDVDPTPGDGVSYDIPDGNLFGEGGAYPTARYPDADASKTRPEIYVMGLRNPYRLGPDPDTGALYWGEVGPDSRVNNPNRGPRHQEEFNRTTEAMNGGWPYCGGEVGDDLTNQGFGGAYVDWDFVADTYRTNPDGTPKRFPCNDPDQMAGVNDSPNSTGLQDLPPMTDAWIPYSTSAPFKYPEVEGSTPAGAQVYRQSQNTAPKDTAFPAYYEGSVFIAEMSRGWIKEVRVNEAGEIQSINDFMGGFYAPGDFEFGPDGSLYVLEYGSGFFSGSPDTKLVRIDYAASGRAPRAVAAADPAEGGVPLTVAFSSAGTNDPDGDTVTYAWDFDEDGVADSTEANPSHTFDEPGDYAVVLTVTDATGKSATAQATVNVGNTRPKVDIELPVDGGFFDAGDDIDFRVGVTDAEETVDCAEVVVSEGLGHDAHAHPNLSVNGCEGTMRTAASTDHGPDANTYGVLSATYADSGGNGGANASLTGQDVITLQPKLRQAEHASGRSGVGYTGYDDKSGTRPGGGGLITGMGEGNWVSFDPMSLVNMTSAAITYSGGAGNGASIELRAGSPTGPVVADVPLDGGTQGLYFYKTVTGDITGREADAGGRALYFVYSGSGDINLDEIRITGTGVASNVPPTITSATAEPADGPAPLDVTFGAEATDPDGDEITYSWDFGVEGTDADVSDQQNPTYAYAEPGRYTATVTATDSTGKSSQKTVPVTVRRPCATPPTPDEGYEMLFNGSDLTGWQQAGPGGFSVEDCTLTSFGGLGLLWYSERQFQDYSLKMQFKLSDEGDNSGVFQRFPDPGDDPFVAVNDGHEIQIKEGQPGDEPQKTGSVYNFDREDRRNANPIGEWNDYEIKVVGQTYTASLNGVVVNEYTSDGSRGAEGFVGLQNHGTNDAVAFRNVQVKELDVPEPFISKVDVDPTRGGAPLAVAFTAEGIDRQGDEITYEWDFGDGSALENGGASVSHTYTEGGTYEATVTPVDADGNRGASRTMAAITVLVDPVATASATPSCGLAPLAVQFAGSATDPQDQAVTFAWDFGVEGTDDDVSDAQNPTYTYGEAGRYTANLTVTDPDGNTGRKTVAVRVLADGECRAVADLTGSFNNDGISTHAKPGDGNFDDGGWSYAAELLPESVRANGGPVEFDGVDYEFPSPADGQLNTVEARGQTIQLPSGRFDELKLLGAAHHGDVQAGATITYTDSTTDAVTLSYTDWAQSPKFGETIAVNMPHRHDPSGDTGPRVYIFGQTIPVDPTKDLASITLPDEDRLHLFAISAVGSEVTEPCDAPRSDEFNDDVLDDNCNWQVRRADAGLYSLSDGALHLTAGPGEYADAPNLILQAAPAGDWSTTTKLTFDPNEAGQQAGLVVAGAGGSGFAKLMFVNKGNGNEWIEFLRSSDPSNNFDFSGNWNTGGGSFDGPFLPADFPTTFWLRLSSDGTNLTGHYSTDGETFTQVGDPRALSGIDRPQVGLMALRGSSSSARVADYDFVRFGNEDPQGRTWAVDAVDDSTGNRWVSEDTGTSEVTVQVGDTVEWQFDRATMGHDVTSRSSNWNISEYRNPNGEPVRHTFTEPGTYEYWCSIHGQTMSGTVVVEGASANKPPTADPFVDPRAGEAPLSVHFEARATDPDGDPLSYEWDFGTADDDSDKATTSHAHFTYTNAGDYTATLTISDGRGGELRREFPISVGGEAPVVNAGASTTSGPAPLNVTFMGSATDAQGGPLTYEWDFGVPGTDADTASGNRVQYTYTEPGSYTATLTVTDPDGNEGTDTVAVEVSDGPRPMPGISASAVPSSGQAPLAVDFSTEVTTTGEFSPYADGTTAYPDIAGTAEMVRRRGATEATLEVTGLKPEAAHMVHVHEEACDSNNGGAHFRFDESLPFGEDNEIWLPFTSDAVGASGVVTVEQPQRAGAKAVSMVIHDPDNPAKRIACVDLDPSVAGLSYAWDFGDGETGNGPDAQHTYDEAGTYTATVTVSDGAESEAQATVEVTVEDVADTQAPQTAITAGPSGTVRSPTAVFRFASSEPVGGSFRCSLDGQAYRTCSSPVVFRGLGDGEHTLRVTAVDAAGNEDSTPATRTWLVDTRGPKIRDTGPQGTTRDRTPAISAVVTDAGKELRKGDLELFVDGRRITSFGYDPGSDRLRYVPERALALGRHSVKVVAEDAAGNREARSWSFRVMRR
jgi:PKD repeat protein